MSVWFLLCVVWSMSIYSADKQYTTPLHRAAQQGDYMIASWLLTNCSDHCSIDQLNNEGKTPLQLASECACTGKSFCKHAQVASLLLNAGANPNPVSEHLCDGSPLHVAVRKKWPCVVELLLAKGADPFAKDVNKETPYDVATSGRISRLLLKHSLNGYPGSDQFDLYDYRVKIKQLLKITDSLLALQDS